MISVCPFIFFADIFNAPKYIRQFEKNVIREAKIKKVQRYLCTFYYFKNPRLLAGVYVWQAKPYNKTVRQDGFSKITPMSSHHKRTIRTLSHSFYYLKDYISLF